MFVNFSLETHYKFEPAASNHVFRLRASPASDVRQRIISASLTVMPATNCAELVEPPHGNRVFTGRIDAPHAEFHFLSKGTAELRPDIFDTTPGPGWLAHASTMTYCGPALEALTAKIGKVDASKFETLLCAMNAVYAALTYKSGATSTQTTAEEALSAGCGVCQDYAHVLLAVLRRNGIACRYVAGLVQGIGQTHAWVEVWTPQGWRHLDPTENKVCEEGYLVLAKGADFLQAAIEQGIVRGVATQSITTVASLTPAECHSRN